MGTWELIDFMRPATGEWLDERPTTVIESESQLRQELERLRQRQPAFVVLFGPAGETLGIGLGPEWSGLEWAPVPGQSDVKRAVNPHPVAAKPVEVRDGGGGRVFWTEQLLPTDEVIEAVVHFYLEGRPADSVRWKNP
jgi:hypothetical protein